MTEKGRGNGMAAKVNQMLRERRKVTSHKFKEAERKREREREKSH